MAEIIGGAGNDILWSSLPSGSYPFNTLNGGAGFDIVVYTNSKSSIVSSVGAGGHVTLEKLNGHIDYLTDIEGIVGSPFNDDLQGDDGDNYFRGGKGADSIDGGLGHDRASYAYSDAGVDVDLTRAVQIGGDAQGDRLYSIEKLTGSDHADRLVGNAKDNEFSGGKGGDYIDGGAGIDFVDYRGSTSVDIDLTRTLQHGGHAEGDQLVSIEGVRGSTAADHIVGSGTNEHLIGDAGNDYLDGAGGDDILHGGVGDDALYGGAGNDDLNGASGNNILSGGTGDDTVTTIGEGAADGGDGVDTLILNFENRDPHNIYGARMTVAADGTIVTSYTTNFLTPPNVTLTATGFERVEVHGTQGNDTLTGTNSNDVILADAGDDSVQGTSGGDFVDGGAGYDSIHIDYRPFFSGDVTVDLVAGTATGFATLKNFEAGWVYTGAGNDHIVGGSAGNSIITGAGDDIIQVFGGRNTIDVSNGQDSGFDVVIGGDGRDSIYAGHRGSLDGGGGLDDDLTLRLFRPGALEVDGHAGTVSSGLTFQNFEILNIRRGTVAGDDTLRGSDNKDSIWGGGGNDTLHGRGGDDDLRGDAGDDVMTGGAGADQFVFGTGHDTVTDFNADEGDMIRLTYPSFNQNFHFDTDVTDTADGVLITSSATGATMLLEGLTKADLSDGDITYL